MTPDFGIEGSNRRGHGCVSAGNESDHYSYGGPLGIVATFQSYRALFTEDDWIEDLLGLGGVTWSNSCRYRIAEKQPLYSRLRY